jgi:carboxylesterase type B
MRNARRNADARRSRRRAFPVNATTVPVWRYVYVHADSTGALAGKGASHAVDLPFWFHTFSAVKSFTPSFEEVALADTLVASLGRFAATGDPNPPDAPFWSHYDATDPYVQLDVVIGAGTGYHPVNCDYWDGL